MPPGSAGDWLASSSSRSPRREVLQEAPPFTDLYQGRHLSPAHGRADSARLPRDCLPGCVKKGLAQNGKKLFRCQAGLLENVRRCRAFHGPMGRDRQLEDFCREVFLESNVAAALSNYTPTGALQSGNNAVVIKGRDFGHTTNSRTSTPSLPDKSSSTGSK